MKKSFFALASLLLVFASATSAFAEKKPLYKDKNASIDQRVEDLLSRMTLHEKVLQLQNRDAGPGGGDISRRFNGESVGTIHEMGHEAEECAVIIRDIQRYMADSTRLGIPVLTGAEGIQGILQNGSTLFPHSVAQGSTFNPELISKMTDAAGAEAVAMGIHQILSPVLDITRDLRWGRVEETFGEDPYLISEMGIAFINGYQNHRLTCMPKHFVAHGTPTGGLNCAHVSGGERELRNLYLYPFDKVIKATDPLAVMSCYSAYDGIAVSASRYFMTDILRGELGFRGYVYSDWGSVGRVKDFHYMVPTSEDAARVSLIAGIDLNVDWTYQTLEKQVEDGILDEAYIDTAVRRMLYVKFALGLFDEADEDVKKVNKVVRSKEHIAIAKEVADESAILLENNGILPLDITKYKSIAVVGPQGNQTVYGDYSWTRPDTKEGVTLYQGLCNAVGNSAKVDYVEGCDWWSQNGDHIPEAVALVEKSDVAIVAVGTRSNYLGRGPKKSTAGEGFDLSSLELPGRQLDLLKAVKATGKPMVVVFIAGKPLAMPWVKDNADAILVQWYAGEQQGNSAADILLGNVNPSGRLNVSFPRSTGNSPCYYNHYKTDREQLNDRGGSYEEPAGHYIFEKPYALWNFGYGLSYTEFEYSDMRIAKDRYCAGDDYIRVEVDVENCGDRDGKETVQLYINDKYSTVAVPIKQLKAFKKVNIKAGEKTTVTLEVPIKELSLVNERLQRVIEPGEFEIQVGSSSDRIHFTKTIIYE